MISLHYIASKMEIPAKLKTFDEVTKEERMKLKAEILADLDVNFISENNSSEPDVFATEHLRTSNSICN